MYEAICSPNNETEMMHNFATAVRAAAKECVWAVNEYKEDTNEISRPSTWP